MLWSVLNHKILLFFFFFFGYNIGLNCSDSQTSSFGAGIRNHTSSHTAQVKSLSQQRENSYVRDLAEVNFFSAFLQLKTAHLLFEAGCSKFAVASMLLYGLFVQQ